MATILFVSEFCLLDRKSGTAVSVTAMLEALALAGHDCHAITLSRFEGQEEYPLPPELTGWAGDLVDLSRRGCSQRIYRTASTVAANIQPKEVEAFVRLALDEVRRVKPDLVLTYGGQLLWPVLRAAQLMGARTVFYLANANWAEKADIRHVDSFIMPSDAVATLFCDRKGVARERCHVIRDIPEDPARGSSPLDDIGTRAGRFVTMVNPQPSKGGGFFLNLVSKARKALPDVQFMAVESRWGRAQWEAMGVPVDTFTNLHWHPTTEDMAAVYGQSSLLLVPSLAFEASGRIVLEAMLAGIPVLAMDRGGIADLVDGGGFLFDCPPALSADFGAAPDQECIDRWLHFIRALMGDDDFYRRAVQLALAAGERSSPQRRRGAAVEVFEALLAIPPILEKAPEDAVLASLSDLRNRMLDALAPADPEGSSRHEPPAGPDGVGLGRHPYFEALRLSLAQPAMREAVMAFRRGDRALARETLNSYVRALPMDYMALSLLAELVAEDGELLVAEFLLRRAVELAPAARDPLVALTRHLAATGQHEAAEAALQKALERHPGSLPLLECLSELRSGAGGSDPVRRRETRA